VEDDESLPERGRHYWYIDPLSPERMVTVRRWVAQMLYFDDACAVPPEYLPAGLDDPCASR
jgi:hypothetical protein